MKKLILSVLFAAMIGFTFAGNDNNKDAKSAPVAAEQTINLTGKVIDLSTGEALTGVEINLEGTDVKVYSDFDGNFEIKDLKQGEYNIIASYISYQKSLVEKFNADGKMTAEIKLVAAK
jgi:hypothetical protein